MKGFFDHKRPALWITASLAAASVVPAVLLLRKPRQRRPHPELVFEVDKIAYQAPFYSVRFEAETAPYYRFSEDARLLTKEPQASSWQELGQMEEIPLRKVIFDDFFFTGDRSYFLKLRRRNRRAWLLDCREGTDHVFYYLLQQAGGDLYLAFGYRTDEKEGAEERASIIRCLFKLRSLI